MRTHDRPSISARLALAVLLGLATVAPGAPAGGGRQVPAAAAKLGHVPSLTAEEDLLLRAGRPVPAGLRPSRANERMRERTAALDELRAALSAGDTATGVWRARLEGLLASPEAPPSTSTAAALVAGELGQYDLAPLIAVWLDEPVDPWRRWAARRALYMLYGSWFEGRGEWEAWLREMQPCAGSTGLFAALRTRDEAAAEGLRRLLQHEPATALEHLSHPDPSVRARAAEVLPSLLSDRALLPGSPEVGPPASEQLSAPVLLDALLARLEVEVDPGACHALLQSLLDVLAAVELPDESRLEVLRQLAASAGSGRTELALPLARALERAPWSGPWSTPDGAAQGARFGAAFGARALATVLSDLTLLGPRADADVTIDVLGALQSLLARAEPGAEQHCDAARLPVLALVQNPTLPLSVRSAAASAATALVAPADAHALVLVLAEEGVPVDLRYALLGSIGRLARDLDPGSALARDVADSLLSAVADPEADLRIRALGLLADPELSDLLAERDLSLLVERLRTESVPELRQQVIALLRAHPRPEVLGDVLALPELDQLAQGDPRQVAELAGMLGDLAAGRPAETVAAARRLVQVRDEPTELVRRQGALELIAALGDEACAALDAEAHRDVVAWAVAYRGTGLSLGEAVSDGPALLRRLVDRHLPGSAGAAGALGAAARAHVRALFLGDLLAAGDGGVQPAEVREAFDRALESAALEPDPDLALPQRVRRDRARFLLARGDGSAALEDYRELLFQGTAPARLAPFSELLPADLREAAALLGTPGVADESIRRARSGEAFDVLLHLVTRPAWAREPAAVQLQDLEDLLLRASESEDAHRISQFEALLEGLPAEPDAPEPNGIAGSPGEAAAPHGAIWAGLAAAGRAPELHRLLLRARAARQGPAPAPEEPPAPLPSEPPPSTAPRSREDGAEPRAEGGSDAPRSG